jgi:rhamnogalacturonyl hydrolase YesR
MFLASARATMNIRKTLFRLVNAESPESLEEVNDVLEDLIDILIEMNDFKKVWYTGSPDTHFEKRENEE